MDFQVVIELRNKYVWSLLSELISICPLKVKALQLSAVSQRLGKFAKLLGLFIEFLDMHILRQGTNSFLEIFLHVWKEEKNKKAEMSE